MKIERNNILLILLLFLFSCKKDTTPTSNYIQSTDATILNSWMQQCLEITKNTTGFSPPVSARALCYFNVAIYESLVFAMPDHLSLSGQLQGFQKTTVLKYTPTDYDWNEVVNACSAEMIRNLYANMPPNELSAVNQLEDSIYKQLQKNTSSEKLINAKELGKNVAIEIFNFSKSDGGHEGYLKNYPTSYIPPVSDSTWSKTPPNYFNALLPYWGTNKLTILGNQIQIPTTKNPYLFSNDSNSLIYKDAKEILDVTNNISNEQIVIAKYWDDSPGYSGTPTGHIFSLAQQIVSDKKMTLDKASEMYVALGIAANDAFILCWQLKYKYNLLRPITYIQRYIEPYFNPLLATPPFPEFASGHSFQSGACGEILNHYLGNNFSFSDKSNEDRTDIKGQARSFQNFNEMVEEISISRLYGGIHYRTTLEQSTLLGKRVGANVLATLKFKK